MLVYGTRVSLVVGGNFRGVYCYCGIHHWGWPQGYLGGAVDTLIMRLVDIMLVIPTLPLVIVLTNVLGRDFWIIILYFRGFGLDGTGPHHPLFGVGAQKHQLRQSGGTGRGQPLAHHDPSHSAGNQPPGDHEHRLEQRRDYGGRSGPQFLGPWRSHRHQLGKMLAEAQSGGALLFGAWWWIFAPGLGIFLAVFGFMRLGLVLEEIANPRMKRTSSVYRLFRSLDSSYVEEVFNSMDDYQVMGSEVTGGGGQRYGTGLEA